MASGKEIRNKIKSVKSTQKITRAMEMVATSKMRKANERVRAARPYAQKIRNVIGHLANAHPEYKHPYLQDRPAKRIGIIVVSSDRGLAGGLNSNLFKTAVLTMRDWTKQGISADLCIVGAKGAGFFKRMGGNIVAQVANLGDAPRLTSLIGTVKVMLDSYNNGQIDRLYVVYNEFVNTVTQRPQVQQLLPLPAESNPEMAHHWDYIYEPEAKEVLDQLLTRYIEALVYQGLLENVASEQAARMVAMKSASDNAGDIIGDLQLAYNKARQASITQELSEIVGGAAAV
ncbi:MAG: F0F1 ATP synthase subunit gamma [Gammaproteobacteria bacterium]